VLNKLPIEYDNEKLLIEYDNGKEDAMQGKLESGEQQKQPKSYASWAVSVALQILVDEFLPSTPLFIAQHIFLHLSCGGLR
jgi:hypothetical protein